MRIIPRTLSVAESHAKENNPTRTIRRSVEITVEREYLAIVNQPGSSFTALCPECNQDVTMLSAEAAAHSITTTPREIYRWLDSGKLHFQELPTGKVYVCSASLHRLERPDPLSSGESK